MSIKKLAVLILLPSLVMPTLVQAADSGDPLTARKGDSKFYSPHETDNPNVEEYEWSEQGAKLPPFPEDDNLIEFQVTRPNASFNYFIDADSVSYTEADGIVRYTVVIKSRSGAKNVAFEGMRCTTNEYKTYAFGNGKGQFVKPRRIEWKAIAENNYTRYRSDLAEFYFCNIRILNLSTEKIISELKYGRPEARESGFR
jgi:hypothetical protein